MKELLKEYKSRKTIIRKRLLEFKKVFNSNDKKLFEELCFCICTPQSKARMCDIAIRKISQNGSLFNGGKKEIRAGLGGVRFPNNKTLYILEARRLFSSSKNIKVKDKIDSGDIFSTRHWFFKNVKGLGLKESSHFLRNIGLGKDLAILDVHILRNMVRYGIISEAPKSLTEKNYILLEEKLRNFSRKINIPMDELDLLFWSKETGEVFK